MSQKEQPEREFDRNSESGDRATHTTPKVSTEAITNEPQAAAYEPVFKSFSGEPGRSLGTVKHHRSAADLTARERSPEPSTSEFVIEDKNAGKEYAAAGERYVARPSFHHGLDAQLKHARSLEEAQQIQGLFSIEYMLRKAREIGSVFSQPSVAGSSENTLIANNPAKDPNRASDAAPTAKSSAVLENVVPRDIDLGQKEGRQFVSPPDVLTVYQAGKAGTLIPQFGVRALPFGEKSIDDFCKEIKAGREELVSSHPAAPPLVCLDVEQSAIGASDRPSVAAEVARRLHLYVLGKGRNEELHLFDPKGQELPYTITNLKSAEQWSKVRDVAMTNFDFNRGMRRACDYRETIDAQTIAPSDVISVSCHGKPGKPAYETYEEFLGEVKKTQSRLVANQIQDHRTLHKPPIIEVVSCDSAIGPNHDKTNHHEVNSMAARIARDTHTWTIGYGSTVIGPTGKTVKSAFRQGEKGEPAILFDPTGRPRGPYSTPLTAKDWDAIKKFSESH